MSAPEQPAAPVAAPEFSQNRRIVIASAVIVAILTIVVVLVFNNSPPAWEATNTHNAHTLALLSDPVNPATIYAGTETGQILRSDDRGQTWTARGTGIPANAAVSALLAAPTDARIFAGTSAGIFLSADAGKTWVASSAGLPADDGIDALAFGATDASLIIAGSEHHGVYLSRDNGAHWAASATGLPAQADIYGLLISADGTTWYAALIGGGVYTSHDQGTTWAASNTGLPAGVNAFALAFSASSGHTLNRLIVGTSAGPFSSTDNGQTWQSSSKGMGNTRVISLAVYPNAPNQVFAGTDEGVFNASDGGQTWRQLAPGITAHEHIGALAVSQPANQSVMLFAAGDRVYRYPGQASGFGASLLRILILGLLVGGLILLNMRQNRVIRNMTPVMPMPTKPKQPTVTMRASTGHIRGGPAPRAPTLPTDAEATPASAHGPSQEILSRQQVAVVLLPDETKGNAGPADIYPELITRFRNADVTARQVTFRQPGDLAASVADVQAALADLGQQGIIRFTLIGYAFGGAIAIQVGVASDRVAGVVVIAAQATGSDEIARMSPKPVLLIHGTNDQVIPSSAAQKLFGLAKEPKELVLYPSDDHALTGHHDELLAKVLDWHEQVLLANTTR